MKFIDMNSDPENDVGTYIDLDPVPRNDVHRYGSSKCENDVHRYGPGSSKCCT